MINVYNWICRIVNQQKELNDLRNLTDRELRDIGVYRTDIDVIASGMKKIKDF